MDSNLEVKATKELLQQGMIVGDSRVDEEEREGEDVYVKSRRVFLVLIKQGKDDSSLHCCIVGGECCLKAFLILVQFLSASVMHSSLSLVSQACYT